MDLRAFGNSPNSQYSPDGAQPFKGKPFPGDDGHVPVIRSLRISLAPAFRHGHGGIDRSRRSTPTLEAAREATLPPLATKRMATLFEHATQPAATQSGIAASR